MTTIETTAVIGEDRKLTLQLPAEISPGTHRVIVYLDAPKHETQSAREWIFPIIDVGPWPKDLSLRREDMYGDDGR